MIDRFLNPQDTLLEQVRGAVVSVLSSLLATRSPVCSATKSSSISFLSFGVPCWQYPQSDLKQTCRELEERIELHIPELERVSVRLGGEQDKNRLGFVVEGWIAISEKQSHIKYVV